MAVGVGVGVDVGVDVVIAVVVAQRPSPLGPEYDALLPALTSRALESVEQAGGLARLVDLAIGGPPDPRTLVAGADGLLVLGGADVDPELYGEEPDALTVVGDRRDDEYEIAAILAAIAADKPVLAVCRGMQLLNVALGGTLLQDLGPDSPHHGPPDDLMVDTVIQPVEGTRFADVLGSDTLIVRTGNHQALGRVADGLVVSARADDGVVEAVEHELDWVLGVQFHPEDEQADPEQLDALTRALVDRAGGSGSPP